MLKPQQVITEPEPTIAEPRITASSLARIEEQNQGLRELLDREIMTKLDAKCLVNELARAMVENSKPKIKSVLIKLHATLNS